MSASLTAFLAVLVFMMVAAVPVAWSMLISVVVYIA